MITRNTETEKFEFLPYGEKLKESKDLLSYCKNDNNILQRILLYTYNVYSYESIFSEYTPSERKERVCEELLDDDDPKIYEDNSIIKAFMDKYIEMTLTVAQRDHERCKQDIEDLREHIATIPFMKRQKIKRIIEFINPDKKDESVMKEIEIIVEVDNSEEKIKAISVREKLFALDSKLRKIIEAEKIEQEITARTMFEE